MRLELPVVNTPATDTRQFNYRGVSGRCGKWINVFRRNHNVYL